MDETIASSPEASAALARDLKVFFSRLRRRLREASATEQLTAPQASALARLAIAGPSSASVLAGAERVRPQSMATTVSALEAARLIRRTPDPDDGRRQVITLTPAGRDRAQGARATRDEWLARALQDRYSDAERATLAQAIALLDRLVAP